MFAYFPDNYNWSLAVQLALGMGGELAEVHQACGPLRALAAEETDDSLEAWFEQWSAIGRHAESLADDDRAAGHARSAGRKYLRAVNYYLIAERMMTNASPRKLEVYERALQAFRTGVDLRGQHVEQVEIPVEGGVMPALFLPARHAPADAPTVVTFNGYDVTKEFLYLLGTTEFTERGLNVLLVDQPGSGGALRLHGLPTRYDMEVAATAAFDHLEARGDLRTDAFGLVGISLGGYYAPRAAALEPRTRACVAWGACHDVPAVLAGLMESQAHSAPAFQMPWVLGTDDLDEQMAILSRFRLEGVIEKLACPLLVLHGADDRQVDVAQAYHTAEQATAAERVDLKVFGPDDWGDQHCQVDVPSLAIDVMADWLEEVLR